MKYVKLFEDFNNLNEKISVDTSRYERSHGKKPKGRGAWAFYFDRTGGEALFTPQSMDYTDAVKWAKEQAKEAGKTVIYVGESVNELNDELNDTLTNENQNMYVVWIQDHYKKGKKIKMHVVPKSKAQTTANNVYHRYRDYMNTEVGIMTLDQWNNLPDIEKDLSRN